MLVRFSTANYLSFDKEIQLSMVPGRTRKYASHIVKDPTWNGIDLLRLALVFGANASGKSNLVKAMDFARDLIIDGTKPEQSIPVNCHKLRKACTQSPSKFEFEFKYKNNYYLYGFELDTDIIYAEWLFKTNSKTQKAIYERKTSKSRVVSVDFDGVKYIDKQDRDFLKFVARGTRPNQLFLTESIQRNVPYFQDVYSWFHDVLNIIFPETTYIDRGILLGTNNEISSSITKYLRQFDSGISGITLKQASMEVDLSDMPEFMKNNIISVLNPGESALISSPEQQRFIIRKGKDQKLAIVKIMTNHKIKETNEDVLFDLGYESDGTLRMFDLIPALVEMSESDSVFVFDELDRSLHPNLSKVVLQQFLALKPGQNSQMIATTHESSLLDFNVLRRDEIWFTEKDKNGATNLYSLEEFAPRYDKDIRKGYLLGRFGSIPLLGKIRT